MKNQDLSKKHIYYYQEKTNDIIDLQDDYSIEEIGIFTILKATYFKHKGIIPIDRLCRLARFYEDHNKIINFANKIFLKDGDYYKNLDWDLEIEKINKTSNSRRKAVIERWNKSKTEAKNKQDESKTEGNVNDNENVLNEQFEEFWNEYKPLHTSKGNKKKSLDKFKKLLSKNKFEDILSGTKNYIKNCHTKNIYTKQVEKFLKDEAWKDEYNQSESNREQHTADLINKMMKDTLINKIEVTRSNKAKLFMTKDNFYKYNDFTPQKKNEILDILKKELGINGLEYNF